MVRLRWIVLALGALCALAMACLAFANFAFGYVYGNSLYPLMLGTFLIALIAGLMGWVVWQFARPGANLRAPRNAAAFLAGLAIALAAYSAVVDPGDAVFVVPFGLMLAVIFGLIALLGPRK